MTKLIGENRMKQIKVRYEGIGWCQGKIQRQMRDTQRRKANRVDGCSFRKNCTERTKEDTKE